MIPSEHAADNIFQALPDHSDQEVFNDLFQGKGYRVERVCSRGHRSPPGFWYDQDHTEWVIVLRGAAGLQFEGEAERQLRPGDYVLIRPHKKHRVNWTAPGEWTVWLAVHDIAQGGATCPMTCPG